MWDYSITYFIESSNRFLFLILKEEKN
jgi:hypothetical protein